MHCPLLDLPAEVIEGGSKALIHRVRHAIELVHFKFCDIDSERFERNDVAALPRRQPSRPGLRRSPRQNPFLTATITPVNVERLNDCRDLLLVLSITIVERRWNGELDIPDKVQAMQ